MSDVTQKKPLPAFYIAHGGGPCFFMDWSPIGPKNTWDRMGAWLRGVARSLEEKPKAILVISAHWEESEVTVMTKAQPELLFDYYGFPEHTYRLTYPAPGSPALAERVKALLTSAQIPVRENAVRDFDHGVFVPLKLIYPDAEIPIIQISLKDGLDPETHIELGRALAPLRDEGVLIIGSGLSYHNLQEFFGGQSASEVSENFDSWLTETVTRETGQSRTAELNQWSKAPSARLAHPREEHLLPLHVVVGAAENEKGTRVFTDQVMGARVSAYRLGD
ncbi:MAG: dioxygenase [Proteobacteria bacterium]|nr:MAG: dioxygenase [Pseudomonadota bacterium]